jgi:hypothetical protein
VSTSVVFPDEIRGWLTQDEGELLVKAARGRRGLEVGTFCGRSTMLLGQVCPLLVTVDTHRGDRNIGIQDSLTEFLTLCLSRLCLGLPRLRTRGCPTSGLASSYSSPRGSRSLLHNLRNGYPHSADIDHLFRLKACPVPC